MLRWSRSDYGIIFIESGSTNADHDYCKMDDDCGTSLHSHADRNSFPTSIDLDDYDIGIKNYTSRWDNVSERAPPFVGQIFSRYDEAKEAYFRYALDIGF